MSQGLGDELDFEVVVASLRMGREDMGGYLSELASRLARALPRQVEVTRQGVLKRRVSGITVDLGSLRYGIEDDHGRPLCSVTTVVRGVALRTDTCDLDSWLDGLSRSLVQTAEASQAARASLARLVR